MFISDLKKKINLFIIEYHQNCCVVNRIECIEILGTKVWNYIFDFSEIPGNQIYFGNVKNAKKKIKFV